MHNPKQYAEKLNSIIKSQNIQYLVVPSAVSGRIVHILKDNVETTRKIKLLSLIILDRF